MNSSSFSNGTADFFSPSIAAAASEPLRYSFSLENEKSCRVQGMTVNVNEHGNIWGASYDTGEEVRHNERYSMARGAGNLLWLGDRAGKWYPLD